MRSSQNAPRQYYREHRCIYINFNHNCTFILNHRQIYAFYINITNKTLIINYLYLFEIKNTCTYRERKLEFLRFNGIFSVLIPLFTGIFFS